MSCENCMPRERRQIVFTEKNKAELLRVGPYTLGADQIAVRTLVSSISCGTERANITGDPNVSPVLPENGEVVFPRTAGYSSAGIVLAVGENVTDFKVGDRVAMSWSLHVDVNVIPAALAIRLDDSITLEDAALFHIATFPMAALRKTRMEIGESMLVMGLGILGLIAVQLARLAGGAPVIAADPNPDRRAKALSLGADYALDPLEEGFTDRVRALTEGGVKTAIEVTGIGAGLNQTLDCMARFGRVALLGCTRSREFTVDYYRKVHAPGITLIGAHTNARPGRDSSDGWFTERDDVRAVHRLCCLGRLHLADMVDEVVSPADCTEVYRRLVEDRNFPPVVQFDWTKLEG